MALGGGVAAGLLSAKGKVAGDVTKEALQGKRLSDIQKSILSTKNRITNSDLRLLQVNGALKQTLGACMSRARLTAICIASR